MKPKGLRDIVFYLYMLLLVLDRIWLIENRLFFVRLIQLCGLFLFLLMMKKVTFKSVINKNTIINSVLIFFSSALIVGLSQGFVFNFLVIFNILGFYGVSLYILHSNRKIKTFSLLFWGTTLLFIYYGIAGISIQRWTNGSYNHISVLMIFLVSMKYIEDYRNKKKLSVIPAIIVVITSLYATGRSGILSSLLLLFFVVSTQYSSRKYVFHLAIVLVVLSFFSEELYLFWQLGVLKFSNQGFTEDGRVIVYDFFIKNINFTSLLFGMDYSSLIVSESLTTHSSYLSLHSRFGIGILLVFYQILFIIRRSIAQERIYFFILMVILLRSLTDSLLISDGYMFGTVFYVIFFQIYSLNKEKKIAVQNG